MSEILESYCKKHNNFNLIIIELAVGLQDVDIVSVILHSEIILIAIINTQITEISEHIVMGKSKHKLVFKRIRIC